jgi:glycosyltransferase involved in cell wall biosynthesis
MRKPVVASRGEGTKEMIGDTVVYVDPENPQDLADAIIKTLNHDSMKSTHQIETIISRLNWAKIMNHEEEIISNIKNIEDVDFRKYDYFLQ